MAFELCDLFVVLVWSRLCFDPWKDKWGNNCLCTTLLYRITVLL